MNIRLANKFDTPYFVKLIKRINNNDDLGDIVCGELDDNHLNSLFQTILIGAGVCFVAEHQNEIVGIVAGIISPNMWAPKYLFMHEIIYFVEEDYRRTRCGYLLFNAFDNHCKQLVDQKRIHHVTLTMPKTLLDMNFERYGYELNEQTWIKKGMRHE